MLTGGALFCGPVQRCDFIIPHLFLQLQPALLHNLGTYPEDHYAPSINLLYLISDPVLGNLT